MIAGGLPVGEGMAALDHLGIFNLKAALLLTHHSAIHEWLNV
ncbi:MAG: hypothetical protein OJF50_004458 [Nitrospira sp.]|jgi:hypothetical protein|nr:hypothetical protein [Nitrospira sp.]